MSVKRKLGIIFSVLFVLIGNAVPIQQLTNIPNQIFLYENQSVSYDLLFPFTVANTNADSISIETVDRIDGVAGPMDNTLKISSGSIGLSQVSIKAFGLIPIKNININVLGERYLIPGGDAVGVAMKANGALVVGSSEIISDGKTVCPAKDAGLQLGDIITELDGTTIEDAEHMISLINKVGNRSITVKYTREGKTYTTRITPAKDSADQKYKFGIWVRDSSVGVGTLTYYDPKSNMYGALGHPISDAETSTILSVRQGELLRCNIIDLVKGLKGSPGELRGVFNSLLPPIGDITLNCEYGIYGNGYSEYSNPLYPNGLPIGTQSTVKEGKCSIITTIDKSGPKEYEAEILKVTRQSQQSTKSMVIKVTDERLLSTTGGIVQGMSGSPVIQNGRIIGAVTHVFINDPTQGYAIFIEWMLPQTKSVG